MGLRCSNPHSHPSGSSSRVLTQEVSALVERQTQALFGDVKALQRQMQEAVGAGVGSVEDLLHRVESAIAEKRVETVEMSAATQRRAVLEAVAFGSFLRDVEDSVDGTYQLLTAAGPGDGPEGGPTGPAAPPSGGSGPVTVL